MSSYIDKLGWRIKYLRQDAKISRIKMALKLGVGDTTLERWENGISLLPKEKLVILCLECGVPFPDLEEDYALALKEKTNRQEARKKGKRRYVSVYHIEHIGTLGAGNRMTPRRHKS